MSLRTRTRQIGDVSGTSYEYWYGYTTNYNDTVSPLYKSICEDTTGSPGVNHALEISHSTKQFTNLNGTWVFDPGKYYRVFDNMPPSYYHTNGAKPVDLPPPSNTDALATMAYARSNPSHAVVDIPIFVAELREVPKLFKWAGKTLLKRGANAFLSYQYGWKPLIRDVQSFLDFQGHVDKRITELQRLHSNNGLKRRITLDKTTRTQDFGNQNLHSVFAYIEGTVHSTTSRDIWATVRWRPDNPSFQPSNQELRRQAQRAVGGATFDASSAWNLLPWSWLIDWGSSAGDYFEANRNIVGAHAGECCVMTHTKTSTTVQRTTGPSAISGGDGLLTYETKSRKVVSGPSLTADLHILSGQQWSILGALGIQRLRGIH